MTPKIEKDEINKKSYFKGWSQKLWSKIFHESTVR